MTVRPPPLRVAVCRRRTGDTASADGRSQNRRLDSFNASARVTPISSRRWSGMPLSAFRWRETAMTCKNRRTMRVSGRVGQIRRKMFGAELAVRGLPTGAGRKVAASTAVVSSLIPRSSSLL